MLIIFISALLSEQPFQFVFFCLSVSLPPSTSLACLPPPSKAIQVAQCRIIPQPLRHAGLVRLIIQSCRFTWAAEVGATKTNLLIKSQKQNRRPSDPSHLAVFYSFIVISAAMESSVVSECGEECFSFTVNLMISTSQFCEASN